MAQIREATTAPSPLILYLKDPAVISALDEEKQAHNLKTMLRLTGEKLDRESRRAKQAVARAEQAESRVQELTARLSKAESGKHMVELEAARAQEEIKRRQLQIESLEREVKRLQADVSLLERQRNEADESAARSRDTARKFQMELWTLQAKETGRMEGQRFGVHKWFKTGQIEGWDAGHTEGFESGREDGFTEGHEVGLKQGRKVGRQEGFDEGWEQGRREEREHALQAFDEFFAAEVDPHDPAGPKNLPTLPLSAFSPPSTGTSDMFPLPPTPSTVFPAGVIDSHIRITADGDLAQYKADLGQLVVDKIQGVVLTVQGQQSADGIISSLEGLESRIGLPIYSVLVPFTLGQPPPSGPPAYLSATASPPTTLVTTFTAAISATLEDQVESLKWALENSRVVDIDVHDDIAASDASFYDRFDDLLCKATADKKHTPIVLTNTLPPPLGANFPIVTLMKHPTYMVYQNRISALSLYENLHVKLLPPTWSSDATSRPGALNEWKGKLKLYIGPVLEAFGFERIIFGSSSSSSSGEASKLPAVWYELVRESFAELGVDQDAIDNIFMNNAKRVYGQS
ncbi:hypothetical protein F5I97DRAFT_1935098 [Phlebopus sp. FC_14]|nr:hypothetical protein F5I97DRAFT_1935098 [Phlebopus sp. FC_14]